MKAIITSLRIEVGDDKTATKMSAVVGQDAQWVRSGELDDLLQWF